MRSQISFYCSCRIRLCSGCNFVSSSSSLNLSPFPSFSVCTSAPSHPSLLSSLRLIGYLTAGSSILYLAEVIHHHFLSTSASTSLSIHPHPTIFLQPISSSRLLTAEEEFHSENETRGKKKVFIYSWIFLEMCKLYRFGFLKSSTAPFSLCVKSVLLWQKAFSSTSTETVLRGGKKSWFSHSIHSVLSNYRWCIMPYICTQ